MSTQPPRLHLSTGLQFPEEMSNDCVTKNNRNYYILPIAIICVMVLIGLFVAASNTNWLKPFLSDENVVKAQNVFSNLAGLALFITIGICAYAFYLNITINMCTTAACIPPYKTEATEKYCTNFIADKAATQIGNRNRQMWQGVPPGGIRLF